MRLKQARLAQSVERQALNLVVEGSSPSVGDSFVFIFLFSFARRVEAKLYTKVVQYNREEEEKALEKD